MHFKKTLRLASGILFIFALAGLANAQVDDGDGMGNGLPPGVIVVAPSKGMTASGSNGFVNKSDSNFQATMARRMAEAEQARLSSLKDSLGSPDSEWNVIEPKIKLVQIFQTVAGAMNSSSSLIKNPPPGIQIPKCILELTVAQKELNTAIAGRANAEEIRVKLAKVRETRDEVRKQLAQARQELTALLTVQQEALLFQRGILD